MKENIHDANTLNQHLSNNISPTTITRRRNMAKEQPKDKPGRKKGFHIGPANLPDGTYRRKVVKIKKSLIHKAKVKKSFSKVVAKDESSTNVHAAQAKKYLEEAAAQKNRGEKERARLRMAAEDAREVERNSEPKVQKMHPERQAALEAPAPMEEVEDRRKGNHRSRRPPKKPKTLPFKREEEYAAKVQAEREAEIRKAEQRRKAHEQKEWERQRRKKVMSARTRKGQPKLGKQGSMLLDKVRAMMGSP